MTTPCPNCRTTVTHNDTTGCCTGCGRCFSGIHTFDAHQVGPRDERGRLTCLDPETARHESGRLLFEESRKTKPGEPSVWRQWSDPAAGKWWEAS
jgi:hypothetical protein